MPSAVEFPESSSSHAAGGHSVAITGATGLVGKALSRLLNAQGSSVVAVTRTDGANYDNTIRWDPEKGVLNPSRLESIDAIVHLAGENIAAGRWNQAMKNRIRNSRVHGTRSLVQSLSQIEKRPKTLISASAVGFYGERGDRVLDESAAVGTGFLAEVCQQWEAEAMAAESLGMRVVCVRVGVVMSPRGGALAKMLVPFKLGAGGVVGSGKQYWSWIGLNDLARVFAFCVENDSLRGPVNAVSPESMTNHDFTKVLGQVLHRPTIFPLPAFMARLMLGEMADELLLSSTRVTPQKLLKAGFQFEQPDLTSCLEHELGTPAVPEPVAAS